jgi:hypothetical protein
MSVEGSGQQHVGVARSRSIPHSGDVVAARPRVCDRCVFLRCCRWCAQFADNALGEARIEGGEAAIGYGIEITTSRHWIPCASRVVVAQYLRDDCCTKSRVCKHSGNVCETEDSRAAVPTPDAEDVSETIQRRTASAVADARV